MARELCSEVAADGRQVTHVGVVVRTRSFFTQVKTGKLSQVTADPEIVRRVRGQYWHASRSSVPYGCSGCGWIWSCRLPTRRLMLGLSHDGGAPRRSPRCTRAWSLPTRRARLTST